MFDLLGYFYRAEDHSVSSHLLLPVFEQTRTGRVRRKANFAVPSVRHRLISPKTTDSISCRQAFITTACLVFSRFHKVAMEVKSVAGFVRKRALKSVTAPTARSCCAVTALMPTRCSEMLRSKDTR